MVGCSWSYRELVVWLNKQDVLHEETGKIEFAVIVSTVYFVGTDVFLLKSWMNRSPSFHQVWNRREDAKVGPFSCR